MRGTLFITGDPEADGLLNRDGTALMIGMLLDQQVPMEVAFRGPATLTARLGHLDAGRIAAMSEDDFVAVCCERPAIHRFPAVDGATHPRPVHRARPATTAGAPRPCGPTSTSADELYRRLRALPGFGDEKARIFIAMLGKRMGVQPDGWREAAGKFGEVTPRSVADSASPETLAEVRDVEAGPEGRRARQAGPAAPGRHPRLRPHAPSDGASVAPFNGVGWPS